MRRHWDGAGNGSGGDSDGENDDSVGGDGESWQPRENHYLLPLEPRAPRQDAHLLIRHAVAAGDASITVMSPVRPMGAGT